MAIPRFLLDLEPGIREAARRALEAAAAQGYGRPLQWGIDAYENLLDLITAFIESPRATILYDEKGSRHRAIVMKQGEDTALLVAAALGEEKDLTIVSVLLARAKKND